VSAVIDQEDLNQDQDHLEEERVVEEDPILADPTALIRREEEREEEAPPQDQEVDVQTRADQSNQKTVERAVKIAEEERLTEHQKIAKKSGNTQLTVEIKEVTQEDQETQEDLNQETLEEAAVKAPLLEIDLLNNTPLSQNKMETKTRKSDSLK
jgi:DNA polymerase II large subunit